jgi:hypothetical protein
LLKRAKRAQYLPGHARAARIAGTDEKEFPIRYTTEAYEGRRLQRFIYKGVGPVRKDQGVLWPAKG